MKIHELIKILNEGAEAPQNTCDTLKSGDADREIKKVGVTMFATVDNIKKAAEAGVDFLITHEPTFYTHRDDFFDEAQIKEKKAQIDAYGITVYRYHDNMHFRAPDLITEGMLEEIGLRGTLEETSYLGSSLFTLDTEMTALSLARYLEERLNVSRIRIAGEREKPVKCLALCFGTPEGVFQLLSRDGVDCVLTGEACEWQLAEYARDAASLGKNKSLIVMGHIASERGGMRVLATRLKTRFPALSVEYIETDEVYSYTRD